MIFARRTQISIGEARNQKTQRNEFRRPPKFLFLEQTKRHLRVLFSCGTPSRLAGTSLPGGVTEVPPASRIAVKTQPTAAAFSTPYCYRLDGTNWDLQPWSIPPCCPTPRALEVHGRLRRKAFATDDDKECAVTGTGQQCTHARSRAAGWPVPRGHLAGCPTRLTVVCWDRGCLLSRFAVVGLRC